MKKLVITKARQNYVFGAQKSLNRSLQICMPGAIQDVITRANFGEGPLMGFGVASRILAF